MHYLNVAKDTCEEVSLLILFVLSFGFTSVLLSYERAPQSLIHSWFIQVNPYDVVTIND